MTIFTVFMTFSLIALSCSGSTCPGNWYKLGSRCFKFINIKLFWMEAEKTCLAHEANLASVHSTKEAQLLNWLVRAISTASVEFWIGGYTVSREYWFWSDGSNMNFQDWAFGEPNNAKGNENCITTYTGGKNNWNDDPCTRKLPFVCARKPV